MKKRILITTLILTMLLFAGCGKKAELASIEPTLSAPTEVSTESSVSEESVHEHYIRTVSNDDGTHTTECLNLDGLPCDFEEVTEPCTYDENYICTVCGYQSEPIDPYGFEEIDGTVWTKLGSQWSLLEKPDKKSEKLQFLDGIVELHAIGIGTYNDLQWYRLEYNGVTGYLETKKLLTEEPLTLRLNRFTEEGAINFDETLKDVGLYDENTFTDDMLHPNEDFPYAYYKLQNENGVYITYMPSNDPMAWTANDKLHAMLNRPELVYHVSELKYDLYGIWKNASVLKVTFVYK